MVFLAAGLLCGGDSRGAGVELLPPPIPNAVLRHFNTALSQMDRGMGSREFRESITFLREHSDEAASQLRELLLDRPGSFLKWQLSYLLGEFGGESAVSLLAELIGAELPEAQPSREENHSTDLAYAEEVASRIQAVMSMSRIAAHRPQLQALVVRELRATARGVPMLRSTALFELRTILGPGFQRSHGEFDSFLPPPDWGALLQRRMQTHQEQERLHRQQRELQCRSR